MLSEVAKIYSKNSKNEFLKLYRKKKKFMLILMSHLKLQKLQL